jgi:hypothetical protein
LRLSGVEVSRANAFLSVYTSLVRIP